MIPRTSVYVNSQTSQLTAKSIECVDNAIKSSVNRLRAINTARHLATDGRKAMAALDPSDGSCDLAPSGHFA
jgi:hypothetical protein